MYVEKHIINIGGINNMGKKERNKLRLATMKNFSQYSIDRYIMIDSELMDQGNQDLFVAEINERLWKAIQETNALVEGRTLPFVKVRRVIKDESALRIVMNEFDSQMRLNDYEQTETIDINKLSHLINFQILEPHRRIMVGDDLINGDAKIYINENDKVGAAVDIFLDIAMFNSISFLEEMQLDEKKKFNRTKYEFYKKNDWNSYYYIDKKNPPSYFSFAYAAREDNRTIDYEKYIYYWKIFLDEYFPSQKIRNAAPEEQLLRHIDKGNIKDIYFEAEFWNKFNEGDYLFLRINNLPNNNEVKGIISNYFGVKKCHIGAVKVVPIKDYFRPFIRRQIQELNISAFKIVV